MKPLKSAHTLGLIEAGCDEAGRGCLAGPVVAAAVILPLDWDSGLNDSKQLSEKQREKLAPEIKNHAISWAIGVVSNQEIDEINILNASFLAMHRAIDQLKVRPELLLIDGNRFTNYQSISHQCIVKGDSIFRSIAAASILAKTHRDELMQNLHQEFPNFDWRNNKGYPTKKHRLAIKEFGTTPHHRLSFQLLPKQIEIDF
jgi:ribonuclease HII